LLAWETCEIHARFWSVHLKGRDHMEDLGIGRKIILKLNLKYGVVWIHVTLDRDQWRDLVNTIMKFLAP